MLRNIRQTQKRVGGGRLIYLAITLTHRNHDKNYDTVWIYSGNPPGDRCGTIAVNKRQGPSDDPALFNIN